MSSAPDIQQLQQSKCRSRLDGFLINNSGSGLVATVPPVTHVLCCPARPACSFMSLQEADLAAHVAACDLLGPADNCGVTVYSCGRCHGASTQLDLMRQHMDVYHGLSGQEEAGSQLTSSWLSCRHADASGPAPTGSRKRKSHVPERIRSPASADDGERPSKFPARSVPGSSSAKTAAESSIRPAASSASSSASPASDILDLSLKPLVDLPAARQQNLLHLQGGADSSIPPAASCSTSSTSPSSASAKSTCDILDLSLKRLADASCTVGDTAPPTPEKPQPQLQHKHHKQQQQQQLQKSVGKPQRQNFTDTQNTQLQRWFSEHREKPYPSTADTHRLADVTGLSYPQVKKWFANRRMRTKNPCDQLTSAGQCGEIPSSDFSSGKASPSNWSLAEFRSDASPA